MKRFCRITFGSLVFVISFFNGDIWALYVSAPTNLEIVAGGNGTSVILSWSFVHPDSADGFIIYKSGSPVDSISTDTTSFTDNSDVLGCFYITAYKGTEESAPSNTVSDTVIVTRDLQIWEWWVLVHPSGFGWDTLTGIGHTYYCTMQNTESIDFYLYDLSPLIILSADEYPFEGKHKTGILSMGITDFYEAPPLYLGYFNFEPVELDNYYAICTRILTDSNHYAKIYISGVSTEYPEYIIFDASYQLVQGLRLLGSLVGVEEKETSSFPQVEELSVSPNPFAKSLHITLAGEQNEKDRIVRIYDISGKCIKEIRLSCNQLDFGAEFPAGVYFLKLEDYKPVKVVKLR